MRKYSWNSKYLHMWVLKYTYLLSTFLWPTQKTWNLEKEYNPSLSSFFIPKVSFLVFDFLSIQLYHDFNAYLIFSFSDSFSQIGFYFYRKFLKDECYLSQYVMWKYGSRLTHTLVETSIFFQYAENLCWTFILFLVCR